MTWVGNGVLQPGKTLVFELGRVWLEVTSCAEY